MSVIFSCSGQTPENKNDIFQGKNTVFFSIYRLKHIFKGSSCHWPEWKIGVALIVLCKLKKNAGTNFNYFRNVCSINTNGNYINLDTLQKEWHSS